MKKIILPLIIAVSAVFSSHLSAQDNEKLIKDYISTNKIRDFKKSDLSNFLIDNVDASKSLKGDVVKFQQTYKGLPVYNSVGTVLVKDSKVVFYNDNFLKDYNSATDEIASLNKSTALSKIAADLDKDEINSFTILNFRDADDVNGKGAKQRLVFVADQANLKLAYEYSVQEPNSPDLWNYLIDAHSGTIIGKINLNLSCTFADGAYSHDHSNYKENALIGPELVSQSNNFSMLLVPDNASYNIFALPIEAPTFGSRTVVNNPWILASSPEGWHFDGTTHFTITRGNNVYAYEDRDSNNIAGASPDGGISRNFNFPYDPTQTPFNSLNASTTNLFYISNKVHDIFHKFGFNEAARNFQQNNFGNGGVGNDAVNAESQDRNSFNNANFSTPADGSKPRMQMYLWDGSNRHLFYNAPTDAVARAPVAGVADFGLQLDDIGITGDVKLSPVLQACTALPAGSLNNMIGLVERGTCSFTVKVKNAQLAGAKAVIIYNNAGGAAIGGMTGIDTTITIPSVVIDNPEGEFIKGKLAATTVVNVTLKRDIKYDGSYDNGIVSHEYGHGISNRLTGDGYSCLNAMPFTSPYSNLTYSQEQMGEGWSDFFALMLTNKPGDNASVARGIGTYAIGQAITGDGIRPAKYSPNLAINDYTYIDTNGMELDIDGQGLNFTPDVHSIGFVWATMLWDLHWKYVEKYGYASDVTSGTTSGSSRVLQLVTDALKLQACDPTFIDGRNAILAAELATTSGADRCMIWNAFARRGLGTNASAGSKMDLNDQVESFDVPADCVLSTSEVKPVKNAISIYPNPAKNEFFINFPSNTLGKVSVEIYDMSGKLVSSEDKISPDAKKAISTSRLINGTYMVKVKGAGIDVASKVIVNK
ncbi:metalloprotease [Chryseobacterium sp. Leaf405]|uniref:T9SS-dependent M36 family metallopeptidase n=1 Tax=Chryseobacterium sp. Leaf405 TaxID=1736367 RepID=UPI0006F4E20D|nr:T9SS-dependent M36 family metallopeptidase [Chryseobacterium sp. Leaf405]KQT26296.1 metalloprotease [Chryseobacterium sp. Leaf405]